MWKTILWGMYMHTNTLSVTRSVTWSDDGKPPEDITEKKKDHDKEVSFHD